MVISFGSIHLIKTSFIRSCSRCAHGATICSTDDHPVECQTDHREIRISDAKIDGVCIVTPPVMIREPSPRSEATNSPTIAHDHAHRRIELRPMKM